MMTLLSSCRGTEGDLLRRLHTMNEVNTERIGSVYISFYQEPLSGPDFFFLLRLCCELGHRRGVAILLSLAGMHAVGLWKF